MRHGGDGEREIGEGEQEIGGLRGDDDVRGEREADAGARRQAVHRGDDRHRRGGHRARDRIVVAVDDLTQVDIGQAPAGQPQTEEADRGTHTHSSGVSEPGNSTVVTRPGGGIAPGSAAYAIPAARVHPSCGSMTSSEPASRDVAYGSSELGFGLGWEM